MVNHVVLIIGAVEPFRRKFNRLMEKSVISKCYSSEKFIALNTHHEVVPPGTHFTAESTEVMRIKCLAQGHNILMSGFETSIFASRNQHSNHMTNMLQDYFH